MEADKGKARLGEVEKGGEVSEVIVLGDETGEVEKDGETGEVERGGEDTEFMETGGEEGVVAPPQGDVQSQDDVYSQGMVPSPPLVFNKVETVSQSDVPQSQVSASAPDSVSGNGSVPAAASGGGHQAAGGRDTVDGGHHAVS